MSNRIIRIIRNPSTGAGIASQTVYTKLVDGGTNVAQDDTDSNGLAEFTVADIGYPGPVYTQYTYSSETKRASGQVVGQLGGFLWADTINDAIQSLGIGVIPGYLNELEVTANGSNMVLTMDTGMAVLKDGQVFIAEATDTVTIGANATGNPRIDRVVLRLTREGQTAEGKVVLTVIEGTAAASPSAPALTQTAATWDYSLAQVLVGAGVSLIAVDKVTDERSSATLSQGYGFSYPTDVAAGDIFFAAADTAFDSLAIGTDGQVLASRSSAPAWEDNVGAVAVCFGNGTDTITTSEPAVYIEMPQAGEWVRWLTQNDVAGSIEINVAKAGQGSNTFSDIDGTAPPKTTSAFSAYTETLTGWTTAFSLSDKIKLTVASASGVTRSCTTLRYNKL